MTVLIVFLLVCLVLGFDGPRNVFENTIKTVVIYGLLFFLALALGETLGWWAVLLVVLYYVFKITQGTLKQYKTTL